MENCTIETLSPIHIGSGRYLVRNNEFLCVNGEIAVIDELKVLQVIGAENIDQWLSVINKNESLWDLLKKRKPNIELADISKRNYSHFADKTDGYNLKEQLIDGMGNPYIPGSSIKGAIRSAVFEYLINENYKEIRQSDITKFIRGREKITGEALEQKIFGKDPNTDFFRFLLVGDAIFAKESLVGLGVNSLNIKKNGVISDDTKYLLTEAIDLEKRSSFRLKINNDLLQKNVQRDFIDSKKAKSLSSIDNLLTIINDHTLKLIEEEKNLWEQHAQSDDANEYLTSIIEMHEKVSNCKSNECVLRVGYGSGWLFMTGGWAYDKKLVSDELFDVIVQHSRPRNDKYLEFEFPKSRRMSINYELFGFVKLSLI